MDDTCRPPDAREGLGYPELLQPWLHRLKAQVPGFDRLPPDRILFTAGAARRHENASVRALSFGGTPPSWRQGPHQKPVVRIRGRFQMAEITLRPRFFRASSPDERLRILLHELWHLSPEFDGRVAGDRRHGAFDPAEHQAWVERTAAEVGPPGPLLQPGLRYIPAWLVRPPGRIPRTRAGRPGYRVAHDERDLYLQGVEQL